MVWLCTRKSRLSIFVKIQIVISEPFITAEEFARRTGQTDRAVIEQLKRGQLPVFVLPSSSKKRDADSKRQKRFVDLLALTLSSIDRLGHKVVYEVK